MGVHSREMGKSMYSLGQMVVGITKFVVPGKFLDTPIHITAG